MSFFRKEKPSNDKDWAKDQEVLQCAKIEGNIVCVYNIRDFLYRTEKDYLPRYYDKKFNLNEIKKVYYFVVPFGRIPYQAHVLLSFEFENGDFVTVSVEIRKKKDEHFSSFSCLWKNFELMYVIGSECDLVRLRTNFRKGESVYMYPLNLSQEKTRELFLDIMHRVNKLKNEPEFFSISSNNCATNIVTHLNRVIAPDRMPFKLVAFLPEMSGRILYNLKLIDSVLSFTETQKRHYINDIALCCEGDVDFSRKIRKQ
ncbi:MAG: DUF4105 domain-containing protein [Candidatus Paceibacterota bacterium]